MANVQQQCQSLTPTKSTYLLRYHGQTFSQSIDEIYSWRVMIPKEKQNRTVTYGKSVISNGLRKRSQSNTCWRRDGDIFCHVISI